MQFKTDNATAIILNTPKSDLHLEMIEFSKQHELKNVVILDELKVNNPEEFGQGHGKQILQKIFATFDNIVVCPSYVYYDETETAYSGRNPMNMDFMEDDSNMLATNFYIPQAKRDNRKVHISKSTGGQLFVLMVKEK